MEPKVEHYQVEGNQHCLNFIDRWRAIVAKGRINTIGIIATQSATEIFYDQAGVVGSEFAMHYAAGLLQDQTKENLDNRIKPQQSQNAPANRVVYNMAAAPTSFDFLAWMQTALMMMHKEGVPGPLHVAFSWGKKRNVAACLGSPQRKIMFENVMRPLIEIMGAVEVDIDQIGEARWLDCYTLALASRMGQDGVPIPKLTPSKEAVAKVDQYLNGRRPVVIVLREATHWEHRNSVIPEWTRFIDETLAHEDVIVLRDAAKAMEPLGPYHTMPPCSVEMNSRIALFQRAKCILGVGNGPMTLAFHGDTPWMMFAPLDPSGTYPPGRPEWWLPMHGIKAGDQFPWSQGPHQRIVWALDTFDNMTKAWKEFETMPEFHGEPSPPLAISFNPLEAVAVPKPKKAKKAKVVPVRTKKANGHVRAAR